MRDAYGGNALVDKKEKMNVFFIVIKYHLLFCFCFYPNSEKNTLNAESNSNVVGHIAWGLQKEEQYEHQNSYHIID